MGKVQTCIRPLTLGRVFPDNVSFSNKIQIRDAVQKVFDVKVLHVNTQVVQGKRKRFGKNIGQSKTWKKAMVQLKEGEKIEIFEGV